MLRPPLQELEFLVSVIRPPLSGEAYMESLGQEVDPFVTSQTSHCPLWLSLTHPAPLGLDAMVQTWPRLRLYTFP